jgi:tetratricopeptide (TPR) repeat protein
MMKHAFAPCLVLCLLLLLSAGCSQQASEEGGADDSGAELQEIMSIRDKAEEAYAAALAKLTPAEGEAVEGEPVEEPDPAWIAEETKRIEMDREGQYEVFTDQLVTFINNNPDSQEARAAYADYLAKFVAPAFVNELGNYMKAVEVYDEALALDPENAEIQALRDAAADLRFMTQERIDTVTKGMTYDEVVAICGVANPKHIKEETKRNKALVGWYYPTADRGAAGVYFSDGKVYNMKFDAIKAPEVRKAPKEGEEAAE